MIKHKAIIKSTCKHDKYQEIPCDSWSSSLLRDLLKRQQDHIHEYLTIMLNVNGVVTMCI